MPRRNRHTNTVVRAVTIGLFFVAGLTFVLAPSDVAVIVMSQTKRAQRPAARAKAAAVQPRYSEFPHNVRAHNIACSSCHKFPSSNWNKVRPAKDAFPDVTEHPKHESCLNCHRQQFFNGARPAICTICHTAASPRGAPRHPFPNPREIFDLSAKGRNARSDFQISFPHDKHIDIVSESGAAHRLFRNASFTAGRMAEESCSVCHKTLTPQGESADEYATKPPADLGEGFWLKRGTFKSTPTGHTTCFTCHSQDSGLEPSPANCAACHKLAQKPPPADFDPNLANRMGIRDRVTLDAWRKRDSSGKFRHEFVAHVDLSCDTCHNVQKMNTLDFQSRKVAVSSCSTCHATATVDDGGALTVEVASRKANATFRCTKCHVVFGARPVPDSHLRAVAEAGWK